MPSYIANAQTAQVCALYPGNTLTLVNNAANDSGTGPGGGAGTADDGGEFRVRTEQRGSRQHEPATGDIGDGHGHADGQGRVFVREVAPGRVTARASR